MRNLKLVPRRPELGVGAGVGVLPTKHVDGARAVHLAKLALEVGVAHAHLGHVGVGQRLDSRLVDVTCLGHAEKLGRLGNVEVVQVVALLDGHVLHGALVDGHRVAHQPVLLLQLGVEHVELVRLARGALLQRLLEQVTCALELGASEAGNKLVEVEEPDLKDVWVLEDAHAALVRLESLLKVLVLLEEGGVIEDDLRRDDAQLDDGVVSRLGAVEPAEALLEVGVEGPQPRVLVQPRLHGAARHGLLGSLGRGRDLRPLLEHRHRLSILFVPQLHLGPAHPDGGEVVNRLVRHRTRLAQDGARVAQVGVILLIEARKLEPERVRLARRLLRVDRLHGRRVRVNHLGGAPREELRALEPLVDVVRVLAQEHRREKLGPPLHEPLQPCEPHVEVELLVRREGAVPLRAAVLLNFGGDHRLLELRVRVEDHREVSHGHHRRDGLLVDVARLLKLRLPDEKVGERAPQVAGLISERAQPRADDRLDAQALDLRWVLAHQLTQLHPQRVARLALGRDEALAVEQLGELERRLGHAVNREQKVDVVLDALGLELQVPPVDAHRALLDRALARKLEVERPHLFVLRDRQRPQRAVKGVARGGRRRLGEEELEVVEPDPRHLVHVHQRPLVRAVEPLDVRVAWLAAAHLPLPVVEVGVPDFVAAGQVLERALGDHVALLRRRPLLRVHVPPPVL
mmetsp:Transcript_9908/g.25487  ORF Transcript_9908/g.25487 Transcript_9908/m.25487 type:complete len:687 (-) Transcript_9908:185-2245(-)